MPSRHAKALLHTLINGLQAVLGHLENGEYGKALNATKKATELASRLYHLISEIAENDGL